MLRSEFLRVRWLELALFYYHPALYTILQMTLQF